MGRKVHTRSADHASNKLQKCWSTDHGCWQLAFKANCGTDGGQVDGWVSEGLISELKIKIKKLERDVNHYAGEMSKYWVYWKNECWLADADRYDLGGVSQTSWLSLSLYQEYGECSSTNTGLHTETSAFSL